MCIRDRAWSPLIVVAALGDQGYGTFVIVVGAMFLPLLAMVDLAMLESAAQRSWPAKKELLTPLRETQADRLNRRDLQR